MVGEKLFTATGQIVLSNEVIEATSRGTTKSRAQYRLLKKLCNKLRWREICGAFVYWPQLSIVQQDKWFSEVNAKLSWIEINPRESKLNAESFIGVLERGWS